MRKSSELKYNDSKNFKPSPVINDEKWLEIIQKQERNLIVLEIREEILVETFQKCNEIHTQKQCAEFVVSCAHEAWKKIIYINFFYQDSFALNSKRDSNWCADREPSICKQDTWAANKIPIQIDKNILHFGDKPPEASKISLKETDICLCEEEEEIHLDKSMMDVKLSLASSTQIREEPQVSLNLEVEEEYSADSIEEGAKSVFTLAKYCSKTQLPFIQKEPKAQKGLTFGNDRVLTQSKPLPDVAKSRNVVRDVLPYISPTTNKTKFDMKAFLIERNSREFSKSIRKSMMPTNRK